MSPCRKRQKRQAHYKSFANIEARANLAPVPPLREGAAFLPLRLLVTTIAELLVSEMLSLLQTANVRSWLIV